MTTTTSDGSTASYYELPQGATQLQDLISHRNMNAQDGEIFRAIYRKGLASHSDALRDARKVLFYAQAEVERLEALEHPVIVANTPEYAEPDWWAKILECRVDSVNFDVHGRVEVIFAAHLTFSAFYWGERLSQHGVTDVRVTAEFTPGTYRLSARVPTRT